MEWLEDARQEGMLDAVMVWNDLDQDDLLSHTVEDLAHFMMEHAQREEGVTPPGCPDVAAFCRAWAEGWFRQIRVCAGRV